MVSSLKYEASYIGNQILSQGGNAIDAAIAVSFALAVCEPYDSGLGGGGMALYYDSSANETVFLNFRETTPQLQTYLTDSENQNSPLYLQVGTPGQVKGLYWLWERYGTLPWRELLRPSIQLALQGYQATPSLLGAIDVIYDIITENDELSNIYLKDGLPPQVGDIIQNEPLARTLEQIADAGVDAFYSGQIAQTVVSSAQTAGSYLSLEDLQGYEPYWETPAYGSYRGYQIVSSPYGGGCLIEALNLLELLPVYPHSNIKQLSQMAEVQKQVFADRNQYMGDSRFVDLPLEQLTSKEYASSLIDRFCPEQVQEYIPGAPWEITAESANTTGFVICDSNGNLIALTQTLSNLWGSRIYVDSCGFFLNNQLGDFNSEAGTANSIEPGKAPLTSMSPTILFHEDGTPYMALSAPGGQMIWPALVQVIQNHIDYGMSLDDALNAPRICTNGSFFYCDADLEQTAWTKLEALGYKNLSSRLSIARPTALIVQENGTILGSTERHGDVAQFNDGSALGF